MTACALISIARTSTKRQCYCGVSDAPCGAEAPCARVDAGLGAEMTCRSLLLAVSVASLNAALLSSGWAATCVTDVTATTTNVINNVTGQTGAAVTAVNSTFSNALTAVQTTATQGSFLT